ncbi:hypothetical protein ACN2XU_14675 [Primorskyibacter sp. 2E107]|uniref:hypothetical protein n=1 Tax=Primorskyibacter sp. 2E107 TaxID=3403458 RepID=UPI003AF503C3
MTGQDPTAGLQQALIRAAAHGIDAGRALTLDTANDAPRFVLAHITATVLPRRLTFSSNGSDWLTCDVSGRRLLRVGFLKTGRAHSFDSEPDSDESAQALQDLITAITEACAPADRICVRSAPLPQADHTTQTGVSPDRLASSFGVRSAPQASLDTMQTFVDAAGGAILTAACLDGEMLYALKGDDADIDALATTAEDGLPEIEALPHWPLPGSTQSALLFIGQDGGSPATMVLSEAGVVLIARVAPEAQSGLTRLWHRRRGAG